MKKKYQSILGLAFGGHAFRHAANNATDPIQKEKYEKKAAEYDNPFTDWVNLEIAEAKAKLGREEIRDCVNCGGAIIGDGHTLVKHCEFVDIPPDVEPDAPIMYCKEETDEGGN